MNPSVYSAQLLIEKHQRLLIEWNCTAVDYPQNQCVHHLFEQQAARTPAAIAVVLPTVDGRSVQPLTYQELDRRSNHLALLLKQSGVPPRALIALCMERSLETIVAILGILKAGGVYVPLDPAYPQERLAWMLEDTQAPVLLTQTHLVANLPPHHAEVICLDSSWGAGADDVRLEPAPVTAADPAYINYTSGSTGRPKGVVVPHRGVVRLVCGAEYATFGDDRVFLQLAPISFDAATFEIWGALLHGARCVMFPSNGLPDPTLLAAVIRTQRITTLWLTAALFNAIINEAPETLTGVQEILTGGEALSVPHIQRALEQLPNTQLINGYGPTESTTFTCCYPIPQSLDPTWTSIPIGRPIANTQVYILDEQLQPVPIGTAGELYIGGAGLAIGYLNQPELTSDRFVPNRFSPEPGERLYKTGDHVRYLPDGAIEFIGRKDNQIKLRGFRIELGEIEATLARHESVQDAIVILREDTPGNKQLVAYVTPAKNQSLASELLKPFLREHLAEYMVPAAIVVLEKLPLTPNGKADRRALPAPQQSPNPVDHAGIAPETDAEKALATIWCDVLGLDQVGIRDNFFDLGGTSLLGFQAISRIQKEFAVDLKAVKFYQYPTIAALAIYLSQGDPEHHSYQQVQSRAQQQRQAHKQRPRR